MKYVKVTQCRQVQQSREFVVKMPDDLDVTGLDFEAIGDDEGIEYEDEDSSIENEDDEIASITEAECSHPYTVVDIAF